ncbi:hypothetical protein D9758_001183 [Tetrapyrgos nigripes]|uniref:Uncharacterized protein n=1 Tax=Tetrapyrgos nigripes TaxID=182062 RepID=A0A8H5LUH1_9AGAR|nr:hypothetical protein D9758_001183 [Tetrapyrgos nigripes]
MFLSVEPRPLPDGWNLNVHPRGWIYFSSKKLKAVADQDIRDPDVFSQLLPLLEEHDSFDLKQGVEMHFHYHMCLYINHTYCIASYDCHEVNDLDDDSYRSFDANILNRRRRLYWNFLWTHPVHEKCPPKALTDACDALAWFHTDNLVSGARSPVPFSKAECEELSRVVGELSQPHYENSVAKVAFLAWFLREVCSFRDAESYGLHTLKETHAIAGQRRPKPVMSSRPTPALLPFINFIITFLFFGIPRTYLLHMKSSFEYGGRFAVMEKNWQAYVERLVREYSHFLLISTVLLSATVSLLTINDISRGAQAAATVSAFSALGSIIVGVFSIWRHQAKMKASNSWNYIRYAASMNMLGFHGHAMLLALPPVLLVWAIISFTVSIFAYMVQHVGDDDVWARAWTWTALAIFGFISVIVLSALHTFSVIWTYQRSETWSWTRSGSGKMSKESEFSNV